MLGNRTYRSCCCVQRQHNSDVLRNSTRGLAQSKKALEEKKAAGGTRKSTSSKGGGKASKQEERSTTDKLLSRMVNAPFRPPNYTPEERAYHYEIGRAYTRNLMLRHNAQQEDMAWKLALRDQALAALPPDLRAHASSIDDAPFPLERRIALWTAPIPNFDAAYYRRKLQRELDSKAQEEKRAQGLL
eukprot:TRINITY_DN9816_c0_g1_i1.p2 TRINITY_DN9816_c0_g1~~TRINITY_DN9816_c0_g1_i1.p2  ORF type:complete len:187 (-),score=78.23 TRINITY_DN9816_c0_g1_i1:121-681(-)